ncbi:hypothetical protein Tco_0617518 [Tanacetum coccineum]
MEEVSLTIDEAKLRKMDDEDVRQRCTSGDEHQYNIDQRNGVNKCVRKVLILMLAMVLELGKNPHAKSFYIRKQKEPGKAKRKRVIRTQRLFKLSRHTGNWVMNTVYHRDYYKKSNQFNIVSITEPEYKNLNKK